VGFSPLRVVDPYVVLTLVMVLGGASATCTRHPAGVTPGDAASHAPPESTSSATLAVDTGPPNLMCPDDAAFWVKTLDPSHCETPRELLLGGSPGCLLRQPAIRIVKSATGESVGFVNDSIFPRSVYALCGFRSGDIWLAINGHRLTSPEAALEAHRVLGEAQTIDVEVRRGAEQLTLHLRPIDTP
jgi:hypothetical protein